MIFPTAMPVNKNALLRYKTIDRLSNKFRQSLPVDVEIKKALYLANFQ